MRCMAAVSKDVSVRTWQRFVDKEIIGAFARNRGAQLKARVCPVTDQDALEAASLILLAGGAIVIPTETIYGLTCDAENAASVEYICEVKGRTLDKPSAIFLPTIAPIAHFAKIEQDYAARVISQLLPGPLTIVLKSRRASWPGIVSSDGKIGIRVSGDCFVCDLASRVGRPLVATSASKSGGPDCKTVAELQEQFMESVPLILYRASAMVQEASTVVDLTGDRPRLLRTGAIPWERILQIAG
jgi:L-threonylcarbamoyladenylate synthase